MPARGVQSTCRQGTSCLWVRATTLRPVASTERSRARAPHWTRQLEISSAPEAGALRKQAHDHPPHAAERAEVVPEKEKQKHHAA